MAMCHVGHVEGVSNKSIENSRTAVQGHSTLWCNAFTVSEKEIHLFLEMVWTCKVSIWRRRYTTIQWLIIHYLTLPYLSLNINLCCHTETVGGAVALTAHWAQPKDTDQAWGVALSGRTLYETHNTLVSHVNHLHKDLLPWMGCLWTLLFLLSRYGKNTTCLALIKTSFC